MKNHKLLYKTTPNYFVAIILLAVIISCYKVTVSISNAAWQLPGFNNSTVRIIAIVFMVFFLTLAGASVYALSRFKTFRLYPDFLRIKQPFLFAERTVQLNKISVVKEESPGTNTLGGVSSTNIYTGNISTLIIKSEDEVIISSFEIWGRRKLVNAIRAQLGEIKRREMLSKS